MRSFSIITSVLLCAAFALQAQAVYPLSFPLPPLQNENVADIQVYTFEQLLDHDHPELGTFSQRYWFNTEWWKGPGSPVVLLTPGESDATQFTGYLTNNTLTGNFAEAIGGAAILLEHRYWGESSPYDILTTRNLQYLTLNQSISDLVYFAKNVYLPFDGTNKSNADKAPWVISGGSYAGALAAWTSATQPGTFWAYHASSAPVQAVFDFWQYFYPVQQGMPKNCSKDLSLVIDYMDNILMTGSAEEKTELKTMFGLQDLEYDDDFMSVLQNGPWLWQSTQFYTGYSGFFKFCDAVENATPGSTEVPNENGVGLEKALAGYTNWVNNILLPNFCAVYGYSTPRDVRCFNTHNASNPYFTDMRVGNPFNRQWNWFLCNEPLGYWQAGAPKGTPSIASRLVTTEFWQRQCELFFPQEGPYTYGSSASHRPRLTVDDVNQFTGGWDLPSRADANTRLLWANGEFDPWRPLGVSSESRPGGPLVSTPNAPVQMIPNGIHCTDMLAANGVVSAGVQAATDAEIAQIRTWVAEWYDDSTARDDQ